MFLSQPAGEDSSSNEALRAADQRASPRVHAVLFVVKIDRAHDAGLFRVKDISDTGLRLATHVRFACRERLTIELLPDLPVEGTVAWCDNECCGVELDKPIDCADVLRRRTEQKIDRRGHALRLPVNRRATCYAETGIRAVTITNVSRRGLGLTHGGSLEEGMVLKLVLESGTNRCGTVRWSKDGQAGVKLDQPLTWTELESATHL